jgi:hypothetical protein
MVTVTRPLIPLTLGQYCLLIFEVEGPHATIDPITLPGEEQLCPRAWKRRGDPN